MFPVAAMAQTIMHIRSMGGKHIPAAGAGENPAGSVAAEKDRPTANVPKWRKIMDERLRFKLPLRTTSDVLAAEGILHTDAGPTEQYEVLCNVLRYVLEVRKLAIGLV
jgi:hypothetical protein